MFSNSKLEVNSVHGLVDKEDRITASNSPKGSDDGPLEWGRRWPSACQPSSYQSRLRRGANVGELFNSVRHSRAGIISLVIDRGIVLHQVLRLPSLIISGSSLILSTHSKDNTQENSIVPRSGLSFRDLWTALTTSQKQSQPRQPRSNIPTRICATTPRVVATGSPGAWACSHGHQEPRAPSTIRPPTIITVTLRHRPDAALESTPSPRPPSHEPLPTPSASAPGRRRRPQLSGRPRQPPSTPWPRRAR